MSLDAIVSQLSEVRFQPRTLLFEFPKNLTDNLSLFARAFFSIAHGEGPLTVLEWTSDKWKNDKLSTDFFFKRTDDERTEILAILTVFVHEFTHRIDFLISPFGLHYYGRTILEYLFLQKFIPIVLDDPKTVDQVRSLVDFGETTSSTSKQLADLWNNALKYQIHTLYAWGDVSPGKIPAKYIKSGWGDEIMGASDPFGINMSMEPVTVLDHFYSFRIPDYDKFWYIRPLTIFETKAITNSMLFILHLLSERGCLECLNYYKKIYLDSQNKMDGDYFFLLDSAARIYGVNDFYSLLKIQNFGLLRSTLSILTTICWFALQAPPHTSEYDIRSSNPILRLWLGFLFFSAIARKKIYVPGQSAAEMLLSIDKSELAITFAQPPIEQVIKRSQDYLGGLTSEITKEIWNPSVRQHFDHILNLMKPHFMDRDDNYVSFLGMPNNGNPILACRTKADWELIYTDYEAPEMMRDWLKIRRNLLFSLLRPQELIEQLDTHFLALMIPFQCDCQAITVHWVSRWFMTATLTCGACGQQKKIPREEFTIISMD